MVPVTQWADIEAAPQAARPSAAATSRPTRAAVRLRRTERLVLGSIDGGAHVLQRRGRHLLAGAAVFMLPLAAVQVLFTVLAWGQFERFEGLLGDRGYLGVERGSTVISFLSLSFCAHVVGAFATAYVVPYQLGADPKLWPTVGKVVRRLPRLSWTWVVTHSWVALAVLIYLHADGTTFTLLAVFLSPLTMLFTALTLFAAPVVAVENGSDRMRRAVRLARGRFGAVYGFVWLNSLVAWLLFGCITVLPEAAAGTGLVTFGSYGWLFEGLAAQIAMLVVVPFSAATAAQMYLQLRVASEGLDITLAADAAFGARS